MTSTFRENLRYELDYQGITVKELNAKTGIPVATLDCYLGTRATKPSAEAAVKIARVLGVTVEYLVTGQDAEQHERLPSTAGIEARELVRQAGSLTSEQCKALLRLIKAFK